MEEETEKKQTRLRKNLGQNIFYYLGEFSKYILLPSSDSVLVSIVFDGSSGINIPSVVFYVFDLIRSVLSATFRPLI